MNTRELVLLKRLSVIAAITTLSACGGGGGGGTTATVETKLGISTASDTLTAGLAGTVLGQWDGGGGDGAGGGVGDGGGGAGDGEFVGFTLDFKAKTFKYTVIRSQFGKEGYTNTLTLTPDATGGGYSVTSGGASTPNLFISSAGLVTGSIPLPLGPGGALKLSAFAGARYKDAPTTLAEYAGTYAYGGMTKDAPSGSNPFVEYGTFKINADGTGRICSETSYSDTCVDGFPIQVQFDDPAKPAVIKLTTSDARQLKGYAVAKKVGTRINMTIDITAIDQSRSQRITGALYATTLDSSVAFSNTAFAYTGSWSATSSNSDGTSNYGKVTFRPGATFAFAQSDAASCSDPNKAGGGFLSDANSYGLPGGMVITNPADDAQKTVGGKYYPSFAFPAGPDLMVVVDTVPTAGWSSLTLLRRYSTTPASGGACP